MGTPFSQIIDMALITIQDYKIDKLYQKSPTDWAIYLSGFVIKAVPLFRNSKTALTYDLATQTFVNTLSLQEVDILADYTLLMWLQREINNVTQITNAMTKRSDSERYAESNNLKEKQDYYYKIRETIAQKTVDYGIDNTNWENYANGIFF